MKQEQKQKLAKVEADLKASKHNQVSKDLADSINGLKQAVEGLETNVEIDTTEFVDSIKTLVESVQGSLIENKTEQEQFAKQLIDKINQIRIPEVKVPQAKVNNIIKQTEDIFAVYKPSDTYEDGSTQYFGFISLDGKWFILRESGDKNKTFRYAFGDKDYQKAWIGRASLKYGYYG